GQVKDSGHAAKRRDERVRPAHVAAINRDVARGEPGGVLAGQGEHAYGVAAFLQCRNEVVSQQAISSGNEYLHRSCFCALDAQHNVRYQAMLCRTPSVRLIWGEKPSSCRARLMS